MNVDPRLYVESMAKITQEKYSQIYGVSTRTWAGWIKDPKFPREGGEDPAGVFKFIAQKKRSPKGLRSKEEIAERLAEALGEEIKEIDIAGLEGIELEKYRKIKGEADIIEHRLSILREEVILKTEAIASITQCVDLIFQTLKSNNEQMGEICAGQEAVTIIKNRETEIEEIRNEIANILEKTVG